MREKISVKRIIYSLSSCVVGIMNFSDIAITQKAYGIGFVFLGSLYAFSTFAYRQ